MVNKSMAILALAVAVCLFAQMSNAQLVPTSFGFPTIVQNCSSVAFHQATSNALDYQNVNINFPTTGVDLSFPDISQTSLQTQSATETDYSQTSQFEEFSYPFETVGDASLASFGL